MKSPRPPQMVEAAKPVEVTPLPDVSDAAVRQSKFDALKKVLSMRGRSATLMTRSSRKLSDGVGVHGRLSDVPEGARTGAAILRGR